MRLGLRLLTILLITVGRYGGERGYRVYDLLSRMDHGCSFIFFLRPVLLPVVDGCGETTLRVLIGYLLGGRSI